MNSLKHLGVPIVAIGTTHGADEVLRAGRAGSVGTLCLRDRRIVGIQLPGVTSGAGLSRSLMLRRVDVTCYVGRIQDRDFSIADSIFAWPLLTYRVPLRRDSVEQVCALKEPLRITKQPKFGDSLHSIQC